jgi:hypothetical protein
MSNIRIDNIAPSAGGTYRNAPRGIAAAWVNFDGTGTVAIRDSENVGSITDNGTGDYTVNFTNPLSNGNYSAVGTSQRFTQTFGGIRSGTQLQTFCQDLAGNQNDVDNINITTHGDLA